MDIVCICMHNHPANGYTTTHATTKPRLFQLSRPSAILRLCEIETVQNSALSQSYSIYIII